MSDVNTQLRELAAENTKLKAELREFKLWTPLKEMFVKSGGLESDWELARLDLGKQERFTLDDSGDVVLMRDGKPSFLGAEQFFRDDYRRERPKFYAQEEKREGGKPTVSAADQNAINSNIEAIANGAVVVR